MLLYLMRHGDALQGANDSQRSLSEKGRQDIARVAQFLLQKQAQVDIFYHSPKKRALETAEIVREILNPQAVIEAKDGLAPNDSVENILPDMARWKKNTMVVSHLPFVSKLASRLVTGREDESLVSMPAGTVVILKNSDSSWKIEGIVFPEQIS